jgi:hypothetical protein
LSGRPQAQGREATFEEFVVDAVNEALQKTFDASTAKAVQFYIDAHILAKNPDAYADSVLRMFGKVGGDVVIDSVMKNLVQRAGMPDDPKKFSSLKDCVNAVAKRYRSG